MTFVPVWPNVPPTNLVYYDGGKCEQFPDARFTGTQRSERRLVGPAIARGLGLTPSSSARATADGGVAGVS
jgi:hypothetical protein